MNNLFGTDGIRGVANDTLTVDLAFKVGRYLGYYFSKEIKGKILIGRDTRLAGQMLEAALASGISASGCDVYLVGVCSTPNISILLGLDNSFDAGVMITASHNPYTDNGIKVFMKDGIKIPLYLQEEISKYVLGDDVLPLALNDKIGSINQYHEGVDSYYNHLKGLFSFDLSNKRIILDLANGSATAGAKQLFEHFGAKVDCIGNEPNGLNINLNCGSTHMEELTRRITEGDYDFGFAFDGDADRVLAISGSGSIVDGDQILYLCGKLMRENDNLPNDVVVTTQMSNLGLYKLFEKKGLKSVVTNVGDKYVFEAMELDGYKLGGEQSGHVIFSDYANTGDGQYTALRLTEAILHYDESLDVLLEEFHIYPQVLKNVRVKNKNTMLENKQLQEKIKEVESELGNEGRVLVRPSGTEQLIRIMIEAQSVEICQTHISTLEELVVLLDI